MSFPYLHQYVKFLPDLDDLLKVLYGPNSGDLSTTFKVDAFVAGQIEARKILLVFYIITVNQSAVSVLLTVTINPFDTLLKVESISCKSLLN